MLSGFKKLAARLLTATCLAIPLSAQGITAPSAPTPAPSSAPVTTTISVSAAPSSLSVPARVENLYKNARNMCGPITGGAQNPVIEQKIQDFRRVINQSPTGRDLANMAAQYDRDPAWICFSSASGLQATYYTHKGVITTSLYKSNDEIVSEVTHELRHLYQEKAGGQSINPRNDEDRVHLEYAREADAEATTTLVLWELKQAGHAGPWAQHNDAARYGRNAICYAHISDAFNRAIESGATPPEATKAAFRKWYDDPRLLSYYRAAALQRISINPVGISVSYSSGKSSISFNSCSMPASHNNDAPHFAPPSDYIVRKINGTIGELPSYNINYIQQAGGLKRVLE